MVEMVTIRLRVHRSNAPKIKEYAQTVEEKELKGNQEFRWISPEFCAIMINPLSLYKLQGVATLKGGKMKKISLLVIIAASLLMTACAVPPAGDEGYDSPGYGETMPAPLPPLVILDAEPYYFHNGYHYHYLNGRWFYSRSRSGPWTDLPRHHYPREVRYKDSDGGRGHHDNALQRSRDWDRDRDFRSRDRDRDRRDDYDSHNRDRY